MYAYSIQFQSMDIVETVHMIDQFRQPYTLDVIQINGHDGLMTLHLTVQSYGTMSDIADSLDLEMSYVVHFAGPVVDDFDDND